MLLKWPETWRVAIWKYLETTHALCLMSDGLGGPCRREAWFCCLRVDGWVKRCWFDWNLTSAFWKYFETIHMLWSKIWCLWYCCHQESWLLLRLFLFWAKRCRNDLKVDVEPSSGILSPTMCFISWVRVSGITAAGSSCSAAGRVKLRQIVSKWPKTSRVLFLWLF